MIGSKSDYLLKVFSTLPTRQPDKYYQNWSLCSELAVAATLARVLLLQSKGEEDIDKLDFLKSNFHCIQEQVIMVQVNIFKQTNFCQS